MTAFKKAESSEDYIVRLFEPTGHARSTTIRFPAIGLTERVKLGAFEIKTFRLNVNAKTLAEVDLMET
jgi:alpha-mannosidase